MRSALRFLPFRSPVSISTIVLVSAYSYIPKAIGDPVITLSPAAVHFGTQPVGTTSTIIPIRLTNEGTSVLAIDAISNTGGNSSDFGLSHDCPISPSTLATGTFCTIDTSFTPTVVGARSTTLTVLSNALTSPDTVDLEGSGIADTDGDGIPDTADNCPTTPNPTQENFDGDSQGDACDPDDDNDLLLDATEDLLGTDPLDDDTDDDGLLDGSEDANANGNVDSLETSPLNYDTDSDGLGDGLESGLTSPEGNNTGGAFVPDSDPASTTDPLDDDTDSDGLLDGDEDANDNGNVDTQETDPLDDDTDDDGLLDGSEDANANGNVDALETDPLNNDTDSDGLGDGLESGLTSPEGNDTSGAFVPDSDPTSTTDPLDMDSDDDFINDGVEDLDKDGNFIGDNETNPNDSDTDDDNLTDGVEDSDRDGIRDANETDPLDPDTDDDLVCDDIRTDNDGNGIDPADPCNNSESELGTNPLNDDTDSDGEIDSLDNCPTTYNPSQTDSDGDGTGNVCDPNNVCSGVDVIEENTTYSGSVYCAAESSITSGGAEPTPGSVIIDSTGNVVYSAPVIKLIPRFSVEKNGIFQAGGNLGSPVLCSETCAYSDDGWCDDGGPGSDYALCPLGTDCIDCGPR